MKKQGLDRFVGMSWRKAKKKLGDSYHLLALTKDARELEIAKTCHDYGVEAGMAALASYLYIARNGAGRCALTAIDLYYSVCRKLADKGHSADYVSDLRHRIENMEYLVYYARHNPKGEWPLKPNLRSIDKIAGLANVMLFLACKRISEEGGTCGFVASSAIMTFIRDGLEKKRKAA